MSRHYRIAIANALAVVLSLGARAASACPASPPVCSSLPAPILTVESGDTQEPLLKTLGRELRDSALRPMTIVYNLTGSCTLTQDLYSANPLTVNLNYVPSTAEDSAWTTADASCPCTPDAAGNPIDVGISALFVQTCNIGPTPAGLGVITGPIQGYGFVVPKASDEQAIVAEEAYFVFGFGMAGMVTPWTDEMHMFIRPTTKSTLLSIGANIGVAANKWHGVSESASSDVVNAVSTSTAPEATIGILGSEVYDVNRSTLNFLAYRAYGQHVAYWPDSSATAFDKKNLRDGHYTMWSPTDYIAKVDGTNTPTDANAKYLIDLVLGNQPSPATDIAGGGLPAVITVGLVPDCAMEVTRSSDGGDLSLYTPDAPCGCYYEAHTGPSPAAPSYCTACTDDSTCGTGHCRYGYCEAH